MTSPSVPADSRPALRTAKFVVFSNPRSGSTWLATTLGLLDDVSVDYEIKWDIGYAPSALHVVLDAQDDTLSHLLDRMATDAPVAGSKFVFDLHRRAPIDLDDLAARLGDDVRVVHLTRRYRDVFLSVRRGFYHAPARMDGVGARLRDALADADVRHSQPEGPKAVPAVTCLQELSELLANDIRARSLRALGCPYLQVSYEDIGERLAEIAAFAGSRATRANIADVLLHPAVTKLPDVDPSSLVSNMRELAPLFDAFESLRQRLVIDHARR